MFRPVFLFKILVLSLIVNFVLVVYFLLQSSRHNFRLANRNDYYEINDYYSFYENNPISTNIKVIPMPMFVTIEQSTLLLSNNFHIVSNRKLSKDLRLAVRRYSKYISLLTGISVDSKQDASPANNKLIIDYSTSLSKEDKYPTLGEDESYRLNITKTGSYLYASSSTGIIRGLSTFVQLIERNTSSDTFYIPLVNIIDRPRFMWRGLLLDVSRHWMPVTVIERTLNAMELSKLNVLHLHLSDDQGFRVESIEYNLLHDRKDFFTQKDIQYLVEYARQRRIRIIPEFDIPGHTTSWFVGYPELATVPGPYQLETRWGMMKATMDPTKENTYIFLDKFFKEMTKLFPDPYFHIGGDEVEGSQWTQSETIKKFINDHQLKNKNGLQAYFNGRIEEMLKKYGKIMVGWEEILGEIRKTSTIDKNAVIQAWLNPKAIANAVQKGHRVIVSRGYYLDHLSPSKTHYTFDPIFSYDLQFLSKEQQESHILGGEACMWTEYVTQNSVDSRIWPRTIAIAERFWSSSKVSDENFLYERLFRMNHLLDKMQTGVTHISSYKTQLQNLIIDPNKKLDLLHPLVILADVCEPYGIEQRSQTSKYSSNVPLTTFTDVLQSESEVIWKLEKLPINDKTYRDIFQTWSLNHLRLRQLFDNVERNKKQEIWGQDIELLSQNLAHTGHIGLRILDYNSKKILHRDKNNSMNSWTLSHWILHHKTLLQHLENHVYEVRLAAVRPVRRLLELIEQTP
ncbi:unnamed protein product [Rotaria sp. Silwood1]|nr:unnamed protein product [Rotaria sp. Silwood1]